MLEWLYLNLVPVYIFPARTIGTIYRKALCCHPDEVVVHLINNTMENKTLNSMYNVILF